MASDMEPGQPLKEFGDSADVAASRHAAEVDQALLAIFEDVWVDAKRRWAIDSSTCVHRRDCWRLDLLTGAPLRWLAKNPSDLLGARGCLRQFARQAPEVQQIDAFPAGPGLLSAHPLLTEDLRTAWHPDFDGRALRGQTRTESGVVGMARIEASLRLLDLLPDAAALVHHHCAAVVLLAADPPLAPATCISLTSKRVPGIVYMSDVPPILGAESILHESAHLALMGLESVVGLYKEPGMRVTTPLRSDPRPISGLMHQVFVLLNLEHMYRALPTLEQADVQRNASQVLKRHARHRADLCDGFSALLAHRDKLTESGARVLEGWRSAFEAADA
jgi:HEXXH motif-containing protein